MDSFIGVPGKKSIVVILRSGATKNLQPALEILRCTQNDNVEGVIRGP